MTIPQAAAANALDEISGPTATYDVAFRKLEIAAGTLMFIRDHEPKRATREDIIQCGRCNVRTSIHFKECPLCGANL